MSPQHAPPSPIESAPSERATIALAGFGVGPADAAGAHRALVERTRRAAVQIASLTTRRIVLVTGPSGAGKTTLLRALERVAPVSRVRRPDRLRSPRCLIDWVHPDPGVGMRALAACGLAEARVFLTPVRALSSGQRSRATLARSLARAGCRLLVCDEFGAGLDAPTAQGVARTIAKGVRRARRTLVAASTDERLIDALHPDTLVYVSLTGEIEITARPGALQ